MRRYMVMRRYILPVLGAALVAAAATTVAGRDASADDAVGADKARLRGALESPGDTKPARRASEGRVLGLLALVASEKPALVSRARRLMADVSPEAKLTPLVKALRCKPASLRLYAAEELGRLGNEQAVPALVRCVLHDKDRDVRRAVAAALRAVDSPSTIHPLGRALGSCSSEVRKNAAEAIGLLGDALGYPYLIRKWEGRSGDFPRAYFSQTRQVSYIRDFDTEVA